MKKMVMMFLLMPMLAVATESYNGIWTDQSTGNQLLYWIQSDGTVAVGSYKNGGSNVSGELIIPTEIQDRAVTRIVSDAFKGYTGLTSVTIPFGVTSIGDGAFRGCDGLTSVTIPSSVTSIGQGAFYSTPFYDNLPDGMVILGGGVLYKYKGVCPSSVSIPSSVTSIADWAFYGCSGLTSVTIPSSVTSIGEEAFHGCSGLTSVTIPSSVTSIGEEAFHGCSGLTSVTIPSSATSIGGYAFYGCSGLTSVTIPSSVTSIGGHAFHGCSGLTSVTIPSSVTSIGYWAFVGCSGLTSVTIPDGVTCIENGAFWGCSGLTSVTIPSSVTSIGSSAFHGCSGLTSVTIPSSVTSIGDGAFWDCSGLTSVTIPSSVTSIGGHAFYGCSGLTSVTIPSSVTSIGYEAFYHTPFYDNLPDGMVILGGVLCEYRGACPSSVSIPSSVTSIGEAAFCVCDGLTSVTIPSSVTSIGDFAFGQCFDLTSVTIPSSVTSIGDGAFYSTPFYDNLPDGMVILGGGVLYEYKGVCPSSVSIPSSVTSIGDGAFDGCSGLTSVTIPSSVTSIGYDAFHGCSGLTSVTIPSSVTSIGRRAFMLCRELVDIRIPDSVTYIGSWAFSECTSLTSIIIPSSVRIIHDYTFADCVSLESVTISEGVETIGATEKEDEGCSPFYGCFSLKYLVIPSSVTHISSGSFADSPLAICYVDYGDTERVRALLAKYPAPMQFVEIGVDPSDPTDIVVITNVVDVSCESMSNAMRVCFIAPNGESSMMSALYVTNGIYGRLPEARRDGVIFAGWYTELDGGVRVGPFDSVEPTVTNLYARWVEPSSTLYAQWAANAYSVSFDANGGSGTMASQDFLYDQVQTLSGNMFSRIGYGFKGWSTSPAGEVVYADLAAVSNLTVEAGFTVALFAQWDKSIDVNTETIEDWVGYYLAPKYKKGDETKSAYRKRFEAKFGEDYREAFFKETGKVGQDGARLQVWHDYVAGTDPLDERSVFTATIDLVDGKPQVDFSPKFDDPEEAALRSYRIYGKMELSDENWVVVPDGQETNCRFFKVMVEML